MGSVEQQSPAEGRTAFGAGEAAPRKWTIFRQQDRTGFKYDPYLAFANGFQVGDRCCDRKESYVDVKTNKIIGSGVVIEESVNGRCMVRYDSNGREKSSNIHRLFRVLPHPRGIIVPDTLWFRRLATTQVFSGAKVLEIGCCHGFCSFILSQRALSTPAAACDGSGKFLGIDINREAIERCRREHPHLRFEVVDVLRESVWADEALDLLSFDTVFLDIGGNRKAAPVTQVMKICHEKLANLKLFVIKCEEVASEAEQFLEENGLAEDGFSMQNGDAWFQHVIDNPQP